MGQRLCASHCFVQVVIMKGILYVEKNAFENCFALKYVDFGDKTIKISSQSLFRCKNLVSIAIGLRGKLPEFARDACDGCPNLSEVHLHGKRYDGPGFTIPRGWIDMFIDGLFLGEWKQELNNVIHQINTINPQQPQPHLKLGGRENACKASVINSWIIRVKFKMRDLKEKHDVHMSSVKDVLREQLQPLLGVDVIKKISEFFQLPEQDFDIRSNRASNNRYQHTRYEDTPYELWQSSPSGVHHCFQLNHYSDCSH